MKWEQDLIKDIRYFDYRDDLDWNDNMTFGSDIPRYGFWNHYGRGFSELNQILLREEFAKVKEDCNCILEIGVSGHDNFTTTSTYVFLQEKKQDCIYLGVDTEPKDHVPKAAPNAYMAQTKSENYPRVRGMLKQLGCEKIDVLMIDGWHSINQVLLDWEYTDILSDNGLVVFHDTQQHPGPHLFVKNLDPNKWDVVFNACHTPNDFGIGFVRKKLNA